MPRMNTVPASGPPTAGRRGSSEDDLPLRLHHAQDLGAERGLNSTPDERGPAESKVWTVRDGRSTGPLCLNWKQFQRVAGWSATACVQRLSWSVADI